MEEFRYINYHTVYSAEGTINVELGRHICFQKIFNNMRNKHEHYVIYMFPKPELGQNNFCLFDKQQIKNHLSQLKDILPISYRVTEDVYEGRKAYVVEITLQKVPSLYHNYVLTWVRYLYEYPYNVILLESYRLKKEKPFRFQSIINIFNLIAGHWNHNEGYGHQITNGTGTFEKLSKANIRKELKKNVRLNDIFGHDIVWVEDNPQFFIPKRIGKFTWYDLEYWTSEDFYNIRKKIYLQ